jgi:hypothetical protein
MNMGSHSAGPSLRRAAVAMIGTLLGLASAAWLSAPNLPIG